MVPFWPAPAPRVGCALAWHIAHSGPNGLPGLPGRLGDSRLNAHVLTVPIPAASAIAGTPAGSVGATGLDLHAIGPDPDELVVATVGEQPATSRALPGHLVFFVPDIEVTSRAPQNHFRAASPGAQISIHASTLPEANVGHAEPKVPLSGPDLPPSYPLLGEVNRPPGGRDGPRGPSRV